MKRLNQSRVLLKTGSVITITCKIGLRDTHFVNRNRKTSRTRIIGWRGISKKYVLRRAVMAPTRVCLVSE
jgi:hypothetical protein